MSNLGQRLTQLRKQSGGNLQSARKLVAKQQLVNAQNKTSLKEKLNFARPKQNKKQIDDQAIADLLGGTVLKQGLVLIRREIPLNKLHSTYDASFANNESVELLSKVNVDQCLFVDTETTGLSSAAGTLVFLLGAGQIKENIFVLEQILLTRFSAEKDMLIWFNQKCQNKSHLVSYNGKSFDVPLLTTRYRMNQISSDLLFKKHIDLLHWIRRLHKQALTDCRLPSAEEYCLGFQRKNDLPGSEAPSVWQELIKQGNTNRLKPLIQHHAWDVISLVGLLHHVNHNLVNENVSAFSTLTTAKFFFNNQQIEKAKKLLENDYNQLQTEGLFLLSLIYRRQKKWHLAVNIWQQLSETKFVPAIENLAKYFEHKARDYQSAIDSTNLLLEIKPETEYLARLDRLEKKLRAKTVI